MRTSSKFIVVGSILALSSLTIWLSSPLLVPGYAEVRQTFAQNERIVTLKPYQSVILTSFETYGDSAVIAFALNSSTTSFTVLSSSGSPLTKPVQVLSLRLPSPGNYSLVVTNTANQTLTVAVTYGVFPYSAIQNFYTITGILQNASTFFTVLGLVMVLYGLYLRKKGR
ncbi:MAG: hypothetical protein ACP5HQ_03530 [Thermoprotei archaeon]